MRVFGFAMMMNGICLAACAFLRDRSCFLLLLKAKDKRLFDINILSDANEVIKAIKRNTDWSIRSVVLDNY